MNIAKCAGPSHTQLSDVHAEFFVSRDGGPLTHPYRGESFWLHASVPFLGLFFLTASTIPLSPHPTYLFSGLPHLSFKIHSSQSTPTSSYQPGLSDPLVSQRILSPVFNMLE